MKIPGDGRRVARLALLLAAGALGGCAKFPAAGTVTGTRELLDLRMSLRGEVDPNAYYLFCLDTNGRDSDGPEIIAPFTSYLGNGRATGAYDHYVEVHQNRFEVFQDQPEQPGQVVPARTALGQPFYYDSTSSAGTLSCAVDLATLRGNPNDPNPDQLEINFIAINEIVLPGEVPVIPRQTDGLGNLGTAFISILVQNGLEVINDGIEAPGEIFEGTQLAPQYDITDFRIAVRTGS